MTSNPVHADSARIVPTDIRAAQNSFVCPPGYRMFRIPPMSGARSHMYDYGVRVEEVTDDHPDEHHKSSTTNSMLPETPGTSEFPWGKKRRVPGRFYCLADARCRDRRTVVKISNKCTSSASDHLRIIHGITSDKGSPRGRSSPGQKRRSPGSRAVVTASSEAAERKNTSPSAVVERLLSSECLPSPERFLAENDRSVALAYIKSHTILGLEPLDYMESYDRRAFWRLVVGGKKVSFPVDSLDSRGIKRGLLEIYNARYAVVRKALDREKRTTPIRFVHLSVSRWGTGGSRRGEEYVGVRAHFLTQDFRLESHLLALRRFGSGHGDVSGEKTGTLVTLWVGQVIEEYGLDWSSVAGVTADGGMGAESPEFAVCKGIPGVFRERCIPSALDKAIKEAFGLEGGDRGCVQNKAVRDILDGVNRVVQSSDGPEIPQASAIEGLGEAPGLHTPMSGRLWHPVSHRLERSVETLGRFLANYPALASSFAADRADRGGQTGSNPKAELQEIYSLIKSLSIVVQTCPSVSEPSTPTTMLRLIMLLSVDLDVTRPLELHEPSQYLPAPLAVVVAPAPVTSNGATSRGLTPEASSSSQYFAAASAASPVASPVAASAPAAVAAAAATAAAAVAAATAAAALDAAAPVRKPSRVTKRPSELTGVGRATREMARDAVYRAFGLRRWGEKHGEGSQLFDMVLALHPGCRQLGYVDKLSTPALVSVIKTKVYAQIMCLVEKVVEFERSEMAKALPDPCANGNGSSGGESGGCGEGSPAGRPHRKRPRLTPVSPFDDEPVEGQGALEDNDPMCSAGVFDAVADGRVEEDERIGAAEEAAMAVEAWCAAKLPAHFRTIRTGEALADFWRTYGSKNFRLLSVVARSLLAAPCSAAVLERDVDECGGFANDRQRRHGLSSLDRGYGEMALLLCAAFDSIPVDVPRLSREAAEEAIPRRFKDSSMLQDMSRDATVSEDSRGLTLFGLEGEGRSDGPRW